MSRPERTLLGLARMPALKWKQWGHETRRRSLTGEYWEVEGQVFWSIFFFSSFLVTKVALEHP